MCAKRVYLDQRDGHNDEWLAWRKYHITATDMPKIMGLSRFGTPLTVYQAKMEGLETEVTPVMIRGQEKEIEARAYLSKTLNLDLQPMCFESEEIPYLAASYDSVYPDHSIGQEIKSMGVEKARLKDIEDDTLIQMQTQMLIQNWDMMYLCAWESEDNYVLLPISPDLNMQAAIEEAAKNFWQNHLMKKIPPDLIAKDYAQNGDEKLNERAGRLRALKGQQRAIKDEIEDIEDMLKRETKDQSTIFTKASVKMTVYSKKGTVDWKGICTHWDISAEEVERFRKEKQTSFRFSFF